MGLVKPVVQQDNDSGLIPLVAAVPPALIMFIKIALKLKSLMRMFGGTARSKLLHEESFSMGK